MRVENLVDAVGAGRGLAHLRDDEAELAKREEDVDQIEAELLPLADRQRAGDDLVAAKVEHGGLAQVGDQEDHREEKAEDARHGDLLLHQVVGRSVEALLFARLGGKGLDDLDAGQILLQDRVERRELLLHLDEERLRHRAEDHEHDHGDRQDRQDHQRQLQVGEEQHDQRAGKQHDGLHRQQQALADEEAHLLHIVGGADHQLPGAVAVVVAEGEPLNLGKEIVAEVEGDALPRLFRHVRLGEGKEAAHHRQHQDQRNRPVERSQRVGQDAVELFHGHAGLTDDRALHLRRLRGELLRHHAACHRVEDVLHQLRHEQLCARA